jgi:hypothetical protein
MASVRVYGYPGIVQIEQRLVKQFNSSSVFMRCEPYLWAQKLTLNGATPVEMTVQPNDTATMVIVEVDDNQAVRYELNPGGPLASSHRNASTNSPRLSGIDAFQWFKGATLSFVDASSV